MVCVGSELYIVYRSPCEVLKSQMVGEERYPQPVCGTPEWQQPVTEAGSLPGGGAVQPEETPAGQQGLLPIPLINF